MVINKQIYKSKQIFKLESGKTIDHLELTYETFGVLNHNKDNAILICHALTGSSHVTSQSSTDKEAWWVSSVGPEKAIDTNKYFVICINVLGSCKGSTGPTSLNPATNQPYGLEFPIVTITDMVHAQHLVIKSLHLNSLYAVIGPSMGGMQALLWAILYPEMVKKCLVIASSFSLSPQAIAFGTVARNAIISDETFNNGKYLATHKPKKGLSIARMIGHITYLSEDSITKKFGRKLQKQADYTYDWATDFQVESYLQHQGDKFVDQFDANSFLYLSKALSYFDLIKQFGSLKKAFQPVLAKLLFISISSDWLYPTILSKQMAKACMNINKDASFCEVQSSYGHDAFLIEPDKFTKLIQPFLGSKL